MLRRRPQGSQDALERARLISDLLANIGDIGLVPGLKALAQVSRQVIEIAITVQTNRGDAIIVAERTGELIMLMIEANVGKAADDMDSSLQANIVRFGQNLEKIKRIMNHQSTSKRFWRILNHRQYQREIADCKEMINHAFMLFQVSSNITIDTRIKRLRDRVSNSVEGESSSLAELKEIDWGSIDLLDVTQHEDVLYGSYGGKVVIVKKYKDEAPWLSDINALRRNRQPYYLQILGRSRRSTSPFLVMRDPGTPMQAMVKDLFGEKHAGGTSAALVRIVTIIKQISNVLEVLARCPSYRVNMAEIHIRPEGCPVFVNYQPSDFFSSTSSTEGDIWDGFLQLIAKSTTGDPIQPNYTVGQHDRTGRTATRMSKFLLHFFWDFKLTHSRKLQIEHDSKDPHGHIFCKLSAAMETIERDIEGAADEDDNPLLSSLRSRFASNLCGIWDVWEPLFAKPGDIGVLRGADPRRPVFHRFANVADNISKVFGHHLGERYWPDQTLWSKDAMSDDKIRHTLQVKDADVDSKSFAFFGGSELFKLDEKWDNSAAWAYLKNSRSYLEELAEKHGVDLYDLCLVFSYSKNLPYTNLTLNCDNKGERDAVLQEIGAENGILYYFEDPSAAEGHTQGYCQRLAILVSLDGHFHPMLLDLLGLGFIRMISLRSKFRARDQWSTSDIYHFDKNGLYHEHLKAK